MKPGDTSMLKTDLLGPFLICTATISSISLLWAAEPNDKVALQNAPAERMQWWNDQRFGMFIHWGPMPPKGAKGDKIQLRTEAIRAFNPTDYDPHQWAQIAKEAGMRYVILTSRHAAFFKLPLWSTKTTRQSVASPDCPYSKQLYPDILGEYVKALRQAGLAVGLYYDHGGGPDDITPNDRERIDYAEEYAEEHPDRWVNYLAFERAQVRELLTNYGPIDIFWFDGWYKNGQDGRPLLNMMRKINSDIIINDRGSGEFADYVTPENCITSMQIGAYWESCVTIADKGIWIPRHQRDYKEYLTQGQNWWHAGPNMQYKNIRTLLQILCTIASKGGNLLLNVGPRQNGTIPEPEVELLQQMGAWLRVNGEAIYGTSRSPFHRVPYWGRITQSGSEIYLHVFDWPQRGDTLPLNIVNNIKSARLLDTGKDVPIQRRNSTTVHLLLPTKAPGEHVSVIALDVEGNVDRAAGIDPITINPDGDLVLHAEDAAIFGTPRRSFWENLQYRGEPDALVNWGRAEAYAQWGVFSPEEKLYRLDITYQVDDESPTNSYAITVADSKIEAQTVSTGREFKTFQLASVKLPQGRSVLAIKPIGNLDGALMDFRQLKLTTLPPPPRL